MKEQELRNTIKMGVKSPSDDFTDKVMGDISTLNNEIPADNKWNIRILLIACFALFVLSIFVRIPELEFFDHTIEFSPVVAPIISLIFLFVVFQQLYDLTCIIHKLSIPMSNYRQNTSVLAKFDLKIVYYFLH